MHPAALPIRAPTPGRSRVSGANTRPLATTIVLVKGLAAGRSDFVAALRRTAAVVNTAARTTTAAARTATDTERGR